MLVVLLAGQLMANMDSAIVNVAAPAVRVDLGANDAELELIVAVYILAYALLLPAGARLGDMRGYRSVYLGGAVVFTVASVACGLALTPSMLILARTVQGLGAALMVPQILTGIQLGFGGEARARALALYAVTLSAGAVIGQVAGGLVVHLDVFGLSWRPAFLVNAPVGVVLVALGWRLLPVNGSVRSRRLDSTGMLLLAGAMLLFVVPLVFGRERGWPAWTWLSLALCVPLFVAFVRAEGRITRSGGYPFVDLDVVRIRTVGWGLAAIAVSHMTYAAILFTMPLHLQDGLGYSPLWAGASVAMWAAAFGVAGVSWRRLPERAWHLASPLGYALLAAAYVGIAGAVGAGLSGSVVLVLLLGAAGLGLGLGYLPLVAAFTASIESRQAADLSGFITTVLQLAGVAGIATYGTFYLALAEAGTSASSVRAYVVVSLTFAAAAAVATVAAARSGRSRRVFIEQQAQQWRLAES